MIITELEKIIPKENIKCNEPMSKHTTFKTGGIAEYYIKAEDKKQIKDVVRYAKNNNIPLHIMGNGSNLLISDKGVKGIILKINLNKIEIKLDGEDVLVNVGAGVKVMALAQKLLQQSITGFEELSGIPGTIGGAIKMNAGAYGKEMKDIVISTLYMDDGGNILELTNEEQEFSYRHSTFFENNYVILETKLHFKKGNKEEIKAKMNECLMQRNEKQPTEFPSAGSTFKRGKDYITAKLIDDCGLKGYSIGGAQVSEKHAGFIINKGNATSQDIFNLIIYVKQEVFKKFKIRIKEEIEYIGDFRKEEGF